MLELLGVKNVNTSQLVTADELMGKNSPYDPIYISKMQVLF